MAGVNDYAQALLAAVPESLRDVPHPDLEGRTPRECVELGHVDFSAEQPGCPACRSCLQELGRKTA